MSLFRSIGKGVGTVGGSIIGGGVNLVGKTVDSKWLTEVGDGIEKASVVAMDNAGQFIDGAVKGTYGAIKIETEGQVPRLTNIFHIKALQKGGLPY
ncbi:hypothetical protein [Mangrovibacillus cuniculi]|uniref:Uncharacterized protein n=1 Tax=Mangrovibacillus cuniculi TaxID=2593652 RepID=A0A7S8CCU0_9BACI|nr:hypothetical protein [Mangrovibacillus cuniculi]QPC47639.1 hypothetical protein G8O30_12090 [Mangrovibacillus cuniculi]